MSIDNENYCSSGDKILSTELTCLNGGDSASDNSKGKKSDRDVEIHNNTCNELFCILEDVINCMGR